MAEKTLNNPLNGREVTEAVLDAIRTRMESDCYLNPNSCYEWFSAVITVKLSMRDAGVDVQVDKSISVMQGGDSDEPATTVDDEFSIEPAPPNEVRVNSGQPVPVLTKDENGKYVEKGIKYSKKHVNRKSE